MSEHFIEIETGTCNKPVRRHDGYHAGDFATSPPADLAAWFRWGRAEGARSAARHRSAFTQT